MYNEQSWWSTMYLTVQWENLVLHVVVRLCSKQLSWFTLLTYYTNKHSSWYYTMLPAFTMNNTSASHSCQILQRANLMVYTVAILYNKQPWCYTILPYFTINDPSAPLSCQSYIKNFMVHTLMPDCTTSNPGATHPWRIVQRAIFMVHTVARLFNNWPYTMLPDFTVNNPVAPCSCQIVQQANLMVYTVARFNSKQTWCYTMLPDTTSNHFPSIMPDCQKITKPCLFFTILRDCNNWKHLVEGRINDKIISTNELENKPQCY